MVRNQTRHTALALVGTLIGVVSTALLLHTASERAAAAWCALVLVPWGVLVSVLAPNAPRLAVLLVVATAARFALVGAPPLLSDDLYRFLFEGMALNAGHNPFVTAPAELAVLAPDLAANVNHSEVTSIYPPLALVWFRLIAGITLEPWGIQLATAAVDVGNVALIWWWCRRRSTWPALLYAIHPLPIVESAVGAHLEPLAVFCCLWVVVCARSATVATTAVVAGVATKLLPILFVPWLIRVHGTRTLLPAGLGLGVVVLLALPVLDGGAALYSGLSTYSTQWQFNGLLFPLCQPLLGSSTRAVLGAVGLAVGLRAAFMDRPERAWLWVGTGFLLLSPTAHPWYALWALVPALLTGRRGIAVLSSFLLGSYLVLATLRTGTWTEPWWLGWVTWGPGLVGWWWIDHRRSDENPTDANPPANNSRNGTLAQ